MKHRIHTVLPHLLAIAILLPLFLGTGCTKTGADSLPGDTMLTEVYEKKPISLPVDGYVSHIAGVLADAVVLQVDGGAEGPLLYRIPTEAGESTLIPVADMRIAKQVAETDVSRRKDSIRYYSGGMICLTAAFREETERYVYTLVVQPELGEERICADVQATVGEALRIVDIAADSDGYVYLDTSNAIFVLKPDLTYACKVPTSETEGKMLFADPGGGVYLRYFDRQAYATVIMRVDPIAGQLSGPLEVPCAVNGVCFGGDCDYYYYTDYGIFAYTAGEEAGTLVLDFANSDVSESVDHVLYVNEDMFLLRYAEGYRQYGYAICTKGEDVDLSGKTIVTIASSMYSDTLIGDIIDFNKTQDEIYVVLKDYMQYDGENTYGVGARKLTFDVTNNIIKPDIMVGCKYDPAYKTAISNDMFTDLRPLMDADEGFHQEDLFGCLEKTYTYDGKWIAMPCYLHIATVLVHRDAVGDRQTWSLEEMMDISASLPEGCTMFPFFSREFFNVYLMNGTYGLFVDLSTHSCSFDSPLFIRYLRYLKALPSLETMNQKLRNVLVSTRNKEFLCATETYINMEKFFDAPLYFGKDNYVRIGYVTVNGKGGSALKTYTRTFSILEASQNKEAAWRFIRYAMDRAGSKEGLPLYHSAFQKQRDTLKRLVALSRGGGVAYEYREEEPLINDWEKEYAVSYSDIDWDGIETWIDSIGSPFMDAYLPDEVENIIEEEISAFLAGACTAETAAKMIDSRVSLYLEESK